MHYLLDFLREHTADEQLYFVVEARALELELRWRRTEPGIWEVRPKRREAPWDRVQHEELLALLAERGADMASVQRELHAMVATQIAFADMVLSDARRVLGGDAVQNIVHKNYEFVDLLRNAVELLALAPATSDRNNLTLIHGGGAQTEARAGHLSPVFAHESVKS
jgi:hypothetical protein